MQGAAENKSHRADIVIVGGGPATLGLLTNAMKQNKLNELVTTGDGLAIIEQGMNLGGGQLMNFGINSNTSARGFLKCAYKRREVASTTNQQENNNSPKKGYGEKPACSPSPLKKKKQSESDNEEDSEDALAEDSEREECCSDDEGAASNKQWQTLPLNCFKDFYQIAPIYKMMADYGSLIVPLSIVGMYLNYCGNHLLHYIYQVMRKKVFFPCHKVTKIQLMQNGDVVTHAVKRVFSIKMNSVDSGVIFGAESKQNVTFRSKAVIISNGGHQSLPPQFYKEWFPFLKDKQDKVLLSEQFLTRDNFSNHMTTIKDQKLKNIVIIGASHSGFSCAWLMLFGPATWQRNNAIVRSGKKVAQSKFPDAQLKMNQNCNECCSCSEAKKLKNQKCDCICKCYGYFKYQNWEFDHDIDVPTHFGASSIKIIYRDKIRVFYGTVQQAKADGYKEFSDYVFSNPKGFVYSYTGLRSDAKWLYQQIKKGNEKRVELVQAATIEEQANHLRNADLVIWACGYQTNKIPIKDHEGKEISLSQRIANTQFDVDGKCRICVADGSLLTKTFGTGLAYPTRTNDGMIRRVGNKPDPRADSFSLYCGWIGNRILQNILPKVQLENKLHRTMRNNRKQAIENNPNNNNNNQQVSPQKKNQPKVLQNSDQKSIASPQKTVNSQSAPRKGSLSKIRTNGSSNKKHRSKLKQQSATAEGEGEPAPVEEDELNEDEIDEGQRALSMSPVRTSTTSPIKPKSAQHKSQKASGFVVINENANMQPTENKDANKKQGSFGGYLKATHASETRAKLIKANAQEQQETLQNISPDKNTQGQNVGGIYIPPQITQSQQQYIQKRKEAIEKEQAELQQVLDKHKPPAPQYRNHAGVQSRYMKQVATVAANGAKKAEAAALAKQQTNNSVKKQVNAQSNKPKPKEKPKQNNVNPLTVKDQENHITAMESENITHEEERKVDNYALLFTSDNQISKQMLSQAVESKTQPSQQIQGSQSTQPSPSHDLSHTSPPAPVESAKNTWSSSTGEAETSKKESILIKEISKKQDVTFSKQIRDISSPNEDGVNDAEELLPISRFPGQSKLLLNDHQKIGIGIRNQNMGIRDNEKVSCSSMNNNGAFMNISAFEQVAPVRTKTEQHDELSQDLRQQLGVKLSQNYMVNQNKDKIDSQKIDQIQNTNFTQNVTTTTCQARYENSNYKTQERKKSIQLVSQSITDDPRDRYESQQIQSHVVRSNSKMTEIKSKSGSHNALANFQTTEPLVSRTKKMQEGYDKSECISTTDNKAALINQTKTMNQISQKAPQCHLNNQQFQAQSPNFYQSKVKFSGHHPVSSTGRQPFGSVNISSPPNNNNQYQLAPNTDPIIKNHTQKISSLFARNDNQTGSQIQNGTNGTQSSKGLSFNQYMLKQQEQAVHLQNPLLIKQQQIQQSPLISKQTSNIIAHRPSKSQWHTQMDVQQQQLGQSHLMLQQNGAKIASCGNNGKQLQNIISQFNTGSQDKQIPIQQQQHKPAQSFKMSPQQILPGAKQNQQGVAISNNQVFLPQFYQSSSENQQNKLIQQPNGLGMQGNKLLTQPKNTQQVAHQHIIQVQSNQINQQTIINSDNHQNLAFNPHQIPVQINNLHSLNQLQSTFQYQFKSPGGSQQTMANDNLKIHSSNQQNHLIRPPLQTSQNHHSMIMKTVLKQNPNPSQQSPPGILSNPPNKSLHIQNPQLQQSIPMKCYQIPGLAGQTAINMIQSGSKQLVQGIVGQSKIIHTNSIAVQDRICSSNSHKTGSNLFAIDQSNQRVQQPIINYSQEQSQIYQQQLIQPPSPLQFTADQDISTMANYTNQNTKINSKNSTVNGQAPFNQIFKTTSNNSGPSKQLQKSNEFSCSVSNLFATQSGKVTQIPPIKNNTYNKQTSVDNKQKTESNNESNSAIKPIGSTFKPVKTIYIKFNQPSLSEMQQNISYKIDNSHQGTGKTAFPNTSNFIHTDSQGVKLTPVIGSNSSPQKKPLPQFVGDQRVKI